MKITIEHEGRTVVIADDNAVVIDDVIELMEGALLAIGFEPENVCQYTRPQEGGDDLCYGQ